MSIFTGNLPMKTLIFQLLEQQSVHKLCVSFVPAISNSPFTSFVSLHSLSEEFLKGIYESIHLRGLNGEEAIKG